MLRPMLLLRRVLGHPATQALARRPWVPPTAAFAAVYGALWIVWAVTAGRGAWTPAHPRLRTILILAACAAPLWAALMLALTLVDTSRWSARGTKTLAGGAYAPLVPDEDAPPAADAYAPLLMGEDALLASDSHGPRRAGLVRAWAYAAVLVLGAALVGSYENPADVRYRPDIRRAVAEPRPQGYGDGEKVYIAAMFYNNAKVIPTWTSETLKLIHYLGTDNVFVSIVESRSRDSSPALLRAFDDQLSALNVSRRVLVNDQTIRRPVNMTTEHPRIEFLAAIRNLALAPLVARGGYATVLFSNDIFFRAEQAVELLRTRGGAYDMACALDFGPWGLYDAWVARDAEGGFVSSLWPYLRDPAGRAAIVDDAPARVSTCWNGLAAIRAAPLLPPALRPGVNDTRPALRFRASQEDECFSSECFLLPYDLAQQGDARVFVNPRVLVAYERRHFVWHARVLRHWAVRAWLRGVERGRGMREARMIVGDHDKVWRWAGGECFPWWK